MGCTNSTEKKSEPTQAVAKKDPNAWARDYLDNGETLQHNVSIYSPNEVYHVVLQSDGNLVVYKDSEALWASNTCGNGTAPYRLVMQDDNHLVAYDVNDAVQWAPGVYNTGARGAYAQMQDDGNFVVYDGVNEPIWCTNTTGGVRAPEHHQGTGQKLREANAPNRDTLQMNESLADNTALVSQNGQYSFWMQSDGNAVCYVHKGPEKEPLWASNTCNKGTGPYSLVMRSDQHLQVYDSDGATWGSEVFNKFDGAAHFVMQNDGNAVVYMDSTPMWCSCTQEGRSAFQGEGQRLM
jgi:hypothetical protein